MSVGIIILVAFMAFYTIALYCMLVAGTTSKVEPDATHENENEKNDPEEKKKNKRFRISAWITVLSVVLFAAGIVVGTMFASNRGSSEKVPETAVIVDTTESTSAPDNDILPETETTIPVEETEPVTAPTEAEKPTEPAETTKPTENESYKLPVAPIEYTPTADVNINDLELLACVIYQEAGGNGSCDDCRRYVGDIVLNRVAHPKFPNTIHAVLTRYGQYGRFYWTGVVWPDRAKHYTEKAAVERAYRTAEEILSGNHSKLYGKGYIWQAEFVQGTEGFWCCGHFYGK